MKKRRLVKQQLLTLQPKCGLSTLAAAQHVALGQHSDHVLGVLSRMKLTSSGPAGEVYVLVCKGNRDCDKNL